MDESIFGRLGRPDCRVDLPGARRMEIWRISPTEHVVLRNFSVSGHDTIDVHGVEGLEHVRRIRASR